MGRTPLTIAQFALCLIWAAATGVQGGDPYLFYTWNVSYSTISPLGVPQQGILINGRFPGPFINCSSNNNILVNVFNNLDEPLLFTWHGIQHRKNPWQDGVPGTNCPIPPGKNFTFHWQPKDQIGSFFYYPTIGTQRAAGGFGSIRIYSRLLIPVPYADPTEDYSVLIGDWFTKSHKSLKEQLDNGRALSRPNGVLINGKVAKGDGKDEPLFTMEPKKTYKYRFCNVGLKTSLNFRFQGHTMKLVELEGSHVVQNSYDSLDLHVGMCMAVLVTADKDPKDYYLVVSTRFLKKEMTTKGVIRYTNSNKLAPSTELPPPPVGWAWSINQFRSFRWNLTASAARPNPQGSYHYGQINITRTIRIANTVGKEGGSGKLRYALNGISHVDQPTPVKLAEYFNVANKVFKYNLMGDEPPETIDRFQLTPNVKNVTFRNFVEVILENHETAVQSYHFDGYSFFAVAVDAGTWSPERRKNYNLLDAVYRHTVAVFPKCWAAVMLTFDNAGMWNIRSEIMERRYLGQQLYVSVLSPNLSLRDEYNIPDNALLCGGIVDKMPIPKPYTI